MNSLFSSAFTTRSTNSPPYGVISCSISTISRILVTSSCCSPPDSSLKLRTENSDHPILHLDDNRGTGETRSSIEFGFAFLWNWSGREGRLHMSSLAALLCNTSPPIRGSLFSLRVAALPRWYFCELWRMLFKRSARVRMRQLPPRHPRPSSRCATPPHLPKYVISPYLHATTCVMLSRWPNWRLP